MTLVGFSPTSQIIDPRSGYLTRDGALLVQFLVTAVNGAGAVSTIDGVQTLTNKTIDGDRNTFRDIPASAMKQATGDGAGVVTAPAAGTTNYLALWSNGDLVDGMPLSDILSTDAGVLVNGDSDMEGPLKLARYPVAEVPVAGDYPGGLIYVTDEAGGATAAFSDGTDWRRVQDRAVIS